MYRHPEISFSGLELEFQLGLDFKKELVARQTMRKELPADLDLYITDSNPEVIRLWSNYHADVLKTLDELKRKGYLNEKYEVIR